MSPIIYTPHDCEKPADAPLGTLYQCPECDRVWEQDADVFETGTRLQWWTIEDPRRDAALRAACARTAQPEPSTTPRVTPGIVQLVLDTYAEHEDYVIRGGTWFCSQCDAPVHPYELSPEAHARNMAAAVLEAALDKTTPAPSVLPASVVAVLDAWRVPGDAPAVHEQSKNLVWKAFPFLAARLDQACHQHPGGDDAQE